MYSRLANIRQDHGPDRSRFHRFVCNRWRNDGRQLETSRRESKYFQWQLKTEATPGVGAHHPRMLDLNEVTPLSPRGIAVSQAMGFMCKDLRRLILPR